MRRTFFTDDSSRLGLRQHAHESHLRLFWDSLVSADVVPNILAYDTGENTTAHLITAKLHTSSCFPLVEQWLTIDPLRRISTYLQPRLLPPLPSQSQTPSGRCSLLRRRRGSQSSSLRELLEPGPPIWQYHQLQPWFSRLCLRVRRTRNSQFLLCTSAISEQAHNSSHDITYLLSLY